MFNDANAVSDISTEFRKFTVDRFIKYARIWTTSNKHSPDMPTTPGQWDLAKELVAELKTIGVTDVTLTDKCYVIGKIPASAGKEHRPTIGFLSHIDTSAEVSGKDVRPQLVESYDGKPITFEGGASLDPAEFPDLAEHSGQSIIHTDGNTLLGADDKAGIAIIMGMVEYFFNHPEVQHGPIEVMFTPDEETGKSLQGFPLETIKSTACYTLDGGPIGELEWECFNAWGAKITFTGLSIHLGTARGKMVNAALMAAVYAAMLPRNESPEATDGYYGYYAPLTIEGNVETASLEIYIRDFDRKEGERRVRALDTFAKAVEAQFPGGKVEVDVKLQYLNMKEKINVYPEVLDILRKAFTNSGVAIHEKPIRGGTDGSRLTQMGIPTPNIFTGGRNYHSRLEWLSVPEMALSCKLVTELVRLWGED